MNRQTVKIAVLFLLNATLIAACIVGLSADENSRYLRIHVRANSNDNSDQNVKYAVKEAIVGYLTPMLSNCTTKQQAFALLQSQTEQLAYVADSVLKNHGFDYGARVKLRAESFPARSYNGYTLQAGIYDALIVELGEGDGDNWWCVVYPPLCFVLAEPSTGSFRYVSKLQEIINAFYAS